MDRDVLISIKGLQFENDMDSGEIETITKGEYYKRGGSHYVIYEELTEGHEEPTKNIIKIREHELDLTKRGLVNTHMVFEEHKKNMTNYATPFGDIIIGIDTKRVGMREQEKRMTVSVDYSLEVNYEFLSDCTITMEIWDKDAGRPLLAPAADERMQE